MDRLYVSAKGGDVFLCPGDRSYHEIILREGLRDVAAYNPHDRQPASAPHFVSMPAGRVARPVTCAAIASWRCVDGSHTCQASIMMRHLHAVCTMSLLGGRTAADSGQRCKQAGERAVLGRGNGHPIPRRVLAYACVRGEHAAAPAGASPGTAPCRCMTDSKCFAVHCCISSGLQNSFGIKRLCSGFPSVAWAAISVGQALACSGCFLPPNTCKCAAWQLVGALDHEAEHACKQIRKLQPHLHCRVNANAPASQDDKHNLQASRTLRLMR